MAKAAAVSDNLTATMVAVVQHNAGTDVEQNLSTLETLSAQAASEGAQLITWADSTSWSRAGPTPALTGKQAPTAHGLTQLLSLL